MRKVFFFFLFTPIVFTACEKGVTIDVPQKEPRLVINGLLEKNQLIELGIGKSRGVLDPDNNTGSLQEQYVIKTAIPVVYENNIPIDTLVYQSSDYRYKSLRNKTIRDGFTYTIKVNAPGFTMAEATSILPSQSVIAELRRVRNIRTNGAGEQLDEINIKLNDPAAEKNFYLVQVWGNHFGNPLYCVGTSDKDIESIGEETDPLDPDNCFDGSALLMKDVNFNRTLKHLKLTVASSELVEYTDPSTNRTYRPYVKVYRITEGQFRYIKSYHANINASDNPFAEPVNVFSNVNNGYGIFAVSTVAVDTLR